MIPHLNNESASTNQLNEAFELSKNNFSFEQVRTGADTIRIEGSRMQVQGMDFDITKGGIINLCTTLKIPDPFAERIPDDLFITNVNRLLKEKGNELIDVYFNKKEAIIDINSKISYEPIPNLNLLNYMEPNLPEGVFTRFMFENHKLKLEIATNNNTFNIETRNEIHNAGYAIQHYPTNKSVSFGNLLLMRTSCTNSAIFPNELFREKLINKASKNMVEVIKEFIKKLMQFPLSESIIQNTIEKMHTTEFSIEEAYKQYKKLKRIVGADDVCQVMGKQFNEENIKLLKENFEENPEDPSGLNVYDHFYSLTDFGSNMLKLASDSKRLQIVAGKLFIDYAKAA